MATNRADSPLFGNRDILVNCRNSQGADVRGTPLRLTRYNALLEVYNPYSILQLSEVLGDFRITVGDRCVYSGRGVVSNLVNTGIMVLCEVTLDEEAWLDVDLFSPISQPDRLRDEFQGFLVNWRKIQSISPDFKVVVADFQNLLTELRRWLEQVELGVRSEPAGVRSQMERQVLAELESQMVREINEWMARFDHVSEEVSEELRPTHRAYARRQIHPLVMCAPFVYRTFHKPLGYAGDYEMVNMILHDPWQGTSMFAKLVNVVFLQNPPAEAHRNRVHILRQRLIEETQRVASQGRRLRALNLGCGPAKEVQNFLVEDQISDQADLRLLDFNEETLAFASQNLEALRASHHRQTGLSFELKSVNQLLKDSLRPQTPAAAGNYDYIYCAGLFDYVSDRVCKRLTELFYDMLAPGGKLLTTNVDASKPFRHSMDYLLEWHIIYRNHDQMAQLVPENHQGGEWQIGTDPTGVNLFLEIRKPAAA